MSESTSKLLEFPHEPRNVLEELLHEGARRLLAEAIEAEVAEYIDARRGVVDAQGRRLVVRNGTLPARSIQTPLGEVGVQQPRVRDGRPRGERESFSPKVLPPYLRKTKSIEDLIPWLYLKGVSTGDFSEALQALVGPEARGLSATTITRLKSVWQKDYETWSQRSLAGRRYVYWWVDGVYFNVRLESPGNQRQCILVILGATPEGKKELIAISDGYRESDASWEELLIEVKQRGLELGAELVTGDGALGFWKDPAPGYMEADLVVHCGDRMAGSFASTLVLTDIASAWTECVALAVREGTLVVDAVERLLSEMPFPLRGIDTDNGSEFINEAMVAFCAERDIEFTRSRPYRKNDQAWVEQKNGSVVRRLVGHGRLEGLAATEALARLYSASRLFVNFFQPSFKLLDKRRVGSRVSKRYRTPETPCSRLLASDTVEEVTKQRLRAVLLTLDPLRLLDEIRTVQHHLAGLTDGQKLQALPHRDADLDRFLRSLATAWKEGEIRPTHRADPKPKRYWRTRKDPFEAVWPEVLLWLDSQPDRTAKELFVRLQGEHPGAFRDGQLRTLQRRVKDWRRAAARRLVFSSTRVAEPLAAGG